MNVSVPSIENSPASRSSFDDRYQFIFENSPVPIHETNVSNVAKAVQELKDQGVTDIAEYIQSNPDFINDLFYQSDIFDVNEAMLEMTEADSKEYYLENFKSVLAEPCFDFFKAVVIALFSGKNKLSGAAEITTFKGKKIWIEATALYLSRGDEEIVNYTFREITEKKLKDQAIKLVNERLVGGDFQENLNNLVTALAEAFNLSFVFIGTLKRGTNLVETLAFSVHQKIEDNITYILPETPCNDIYINNEKVVYTNHLDKVYSDSEFVKHANGKSYIGYPLRSKQGNVIGHFAFVNDEPITNLSVLQDVMELYTAWASTELENINDKNALKKHSAIIESQVAVLNDKNQKLEKYIESNKQLKNFAYVASHDLKAPLRTITSFSQLLGRRYRDKVDARGQEFIDFIVSAGSNMQALIDDLLVFSTIDGQDFTFTEVKLNSILGVLTAELHSLISEQQALVKWENLPIVNGDSTKLKRLFQNLISNAIKFKKPDVTPTIVIDAKEKEDKWVISIKDNGIGIDQKSHKEIFGTFHKLHAKDEYEGSGLGLSICQKIVEKHGGEIWLESALGEGTTFYFTLPR